MKLSESPPSTVFQYSAPQTDTELAGLISEADLLAGAASSDVIAFGLDVLGDIVLPPGAESRVSRAQMRAIATLYLAADLEPARVISSAETLSRLAASGAVRNDLGSAAALIHEFWRAREQRIDARERIAFFGRLFGASYGSPLADGQVNSSFEPLMLELCESLYRLGEQARDPVYGSVSQQARLRTSSASLINNLVAAGGSITTFIATEVLQSLKQALAILSHPQLRGIFAARDFWGVVSSINRLAGLTEGTPQSFVRRGKAGMTVIVWLADAAQALGQYGAPLVRLDHPVIPAAVDWIQASLAISEYQTSHQGGSMTPYAAKPPMQVSHWADIGI